LTSDRSSASDVAGVLRNAFDRTFAEPEQAARQPRERFLAVTIDGSGYAMRLADVAALTMVRTIVPLPGARAELLGLSSHRGKLVPVFDLGALLGHGRCAHPRWLALCGSRDWIGLAFANLDGQVEGHSTVPRRATTEPPAELAGSVLETTPPRTVVDLTAVVHRIAKWEL
jgi:chemotaxis signal transduction protein